MSDTRISGHPYRVKALAAKDAYYCPNGHEVVLCKVRDSDELRRVHLDYLNRHCTNVFIERNVALVVPSWFEAHDCEVADS